MLTEPEFSDEFFESFNSSGSIVVMCRCGRLHVAQDELKFLDAEEIEEIKKFEIKKPDKFVQWDCDSISWTYINGEEVVFECPCEYDKMLCQFIENHQEEIMEVIGKIVESEKIALANKEYLLSKTRSEEI